jgi:hypothetical protein
MSTPQCAQIGGVTSTYRASLVLTVLLFGTLVVQAAAAGKGPVLTPQDRTYLEGLMKEFLFDPKGAERVAVKTAVRTVWATTKEAVIEGWLVPGPSGKPRVCFTDGDSIAAPPEQEIQRIDFRAACQGRYLAQKNEPDPKAKREEVFRVMEQSAVGVSKASDLTLAAWLYRLGDEGLAAQALAVARKAQGDPRERLRDELAWSAYAGMVHAYMVRADEQALADGQRLLKLYPAEA